MFIDKAKIECIAGEGGDGAVSWRREKFEPSGGPDGGDGGDGGSIILQADEGVQTLMDYKYHGKYKAENGERGRKRKQFGAKGEDLVLKVPVGTIIREATTNKPIADLTFNGESFTVVKGGRGGKGNYRFKSSIRQAPRFAIPGGRGQKLSIILEVKLIADVGLVGLPNVGKSTLLSILSNAKPKIANYHFTTIDPNLGVVNVGAGEGYIIADIPGLIEGASDGAGLGHDFLRHIERTRILAHVLDMSGSEGRNPIEDFETIQNELSDYNAVLPGKVNVIVANKMDLSGAEENLKEFKNKYNCIDFEDVPEDWEMMQYEDETYSGKNTLNNGQIEEKQYILIKTSGATTEGIKQLKYLLWKQLKNTEKVYETLDEEIVSTDEFFCPSTDIIVRRENNTIIVEGDPIKELSRKLLIDDEDSVRFFEKSLETMGVMNRVRDLSPTENDTINVEGFEFDWL